LDDVDEFSCADFAKNADNIIFATCILQNYLIDQGVGLSDMGSSVNVRSKEAMFKQRLNNFTIST